MSAGGQLKKTVKKAGQVGLTNAGQRESALDRIDKLELMFRALGNQLKHSFGANNAKLDDMSRALGAVIAIVGEKEVEAKVIEQRIAELEEERAQTEASVAEQVEAGRFVPSETIEEKSFVVTQQHNADGVLMHPSLVQIPLDAYTPAVKELLLGRKVDDVLDMPDGNKLTVKAIYSVVELPPAPPAPETAEAVAESLEEANIPAESSITEDLSRE